MSDGGTNGQGGRNEGEEPETLPPLGDAELSARRAALGERLAERRALRDAREEAQSKSSGMRGMAQGLKLASEFMAGILVGAGLGYFIDKAVGTGPFGLVVFLILGFAAGILNVLRAVSPKKSEPVPPRPPKPPGAG